MRGKAGQREELEEELQPNAFDADVQRLAAAGASEKFRVHVIDWLYPDDRVCLAENAARLAALGLAGIDLTFGYPANVVNRHGGGSIFCAATFQRLKSLISSSGR